VPDFEVLYHKMERSISIGGKSESTLTNYARCLATMALHFGMSPLDLDEEQVLDYLHYLKTQKKTPSSSYFKHTLYGLRFAYKVSGKSGLLPKLPALKMPNKLPVILSEEEVKRLITTPTLLKHRMALSLLYGCGLRRSELLDARIEDADLERKMLHIRQGKGNKDRYVPLGDNLVYALKKYLLAEQPYLYLFNGNGKDGVRARFSETGVQWIIKEAAKKAGIRKRVTSHVLRHSYATHLLEMGLDIMSLKELLGHTDIKTTLIYLHVSNLGRQKAFSPMDRIFKIKKA
jgi:integrase/recombinase XerD